MKKLYVDKENTLFLDSQFTNANNLDVTLTLVGESGEPLNTSDNEPIVDVDIAFDTGVNKYKFEFTLDPNTPQQYARAFWYVERDGLVVETPGFSPEDIQIVTAAVGISPEIMPISLFLTSFLAAESKLDDNFKRAIASWIGLNFETARQAILAAQGDLERDLGMVFFRRQDAMARDFYMQDFRNEFWMIQTEFTPIITVDDYQLVYGNNPASQITSNIKDAIMVSKDMGILEFLPTSLTGGLWSALISGVAGLGITVMGEANYSRLPLLFRIIYTHGMDFPTLSETDKASIRNAVGRHTLIELLPRIDPSIRIPSQSLSVDGASKSRSGGMKDILKDYRSDEVIWVTKMRNRYGRSIDMTVV